MRNKKLKGITLVETLLYISLSSLILFIVLNFMLSTQEATSRTSAKTETHQASQFVLEHLHETFRQVKSIDKTSSVFNNDEGKLFVVFSDGMRNYSLTNSEIRFDSTPITPKTVSVTKFFLEPIYDKKDISILAVKITIHLNSTEEQNVSENITYLGVIR
jgi:type II secretory pathway pseudopilin PulG